MSDEKNKVDTTTEIKNSEMKKAEIKKADANVKTMEDFTSPEILYDELIASVKKYHPSTDISMIEKAYKIAYEAHEGQKRKSGEPYIIHPLCVAIILADLELDKETIVAGLLHDVVEDTVMTTEEITKEFGAEVALLVDGVTKLGQLSYSADKVEVQAENLRKMFLAMAKDIRVILIKLADRLHNMRTLKYMKPEKQKEKARETMDIYAPLAQRLGISKIKVELDDLSLKYLEPEVYYDLVEKIALRKTERQKFVDGIVAEVRAHIEKAGIKAQIDGRVKHFFSIYKKMVNQDKTLDQIYDLFAVRIIVDTVKDCYAALGVIHEMYKPIPGRFKDYIAMPKPNMYQSLHTTLIGPGGRPFEIQIRTFEMHRTAEYGIAAHWKYKEASNNGGTVNVSKQEEEKLSWLRQILEWQKDMSDGKEFMSLLKSDLDLFAESVYCFTPAGDVKNLPNGSTPIDFAYSIHSAVGNKMIGARANGKLVNIDYVIQNGDRIEIITSQNSKGPSRDWLKICRTSQAKNKINQWFKRERRDENIEHGKELIERELRRIGNTHEQLFKQEWIAILLRRYGFQSIDDLYASVGYGGLTAQKVVFRLRDEWTKLNKTLEAKKNLEAVYNEESKTVQAEPAKRHASSKGIVVKDIDNCLVRLARCCNPVAGDDIVGFITKGRGVSVHRRDCPNMNPQSMSEEDKGRFIDVWWDDERSTSYIANLQVEAPDRDGVLLEITNILSALKIPFKSVNAYVNKKGIAIIQIGVEIRNTSDLALLKKKIVQIQGVTSVTRLQN